MTKPSPKPKVGLVTAVMIPVAHPVKKSRPVNLLRSFGTQTLLTTALTMTALKAAFGVGVIMLIYGSIKIQIKAVNMHAICEVVPDIRETSDRLILPDTGADPTKAATPHETPCAIHSRGALHAIPFSLSNPEAIPMIDKKLTAANRVADTIRRG